MYKCAGAVQAVSRKRLVEKIKARHGLTKQTGSSSIVSSGRVDSGGSGCNDMPDQHIQKQQPRIQSNVDSVSWRVNKLRNFRHQHHQKA
jgi:hypothetical protein